MITVAGCGGGGGGGKTTTAETTRTVRGNGFAFSAPADWKVTQAPVSVVVSEGGKDTKVAAYTFRTVKPYRPSLWPRAVAELDRKARALAGKLHGRVISSATTTVAGRRARQYVFEYASKRAKLTFFYKGRKEYELYCGWKKADGEPSACKILLETFRLS